MLIACSTRRRSRAATDRCAAEAVSERLIIAVPGR
jgi:hypothetical protein